MHNQPNFIENHAVKSIYFCKKINIGAIDCLGHNARVLRLDAYITLAGEKMKVVTLTIVIAIVAAILTGCNIAGPAYPKRDGQKYLQDHGYPTSFVDQVINEGKLDHSKVLELSNCKSTDVRFLVARNPNLTHDEIDIFIRDKNAFARSGAACNTSLSSSQIDILTDDPSHTVYCKLAGNTSLSEDALLQIHKKRNPGILWFAMNPNCPDSIRQDIERSNDDLAKRWLDITDGWKKDGVYLKRNDGRWYKPRSQNR
jgi:hypothetical protein